MGKVKEYYHDEIERMSDEHDGQEEQLGTLGPITKEEFDHWVMSGSFLPGVDGSYEIIGNMVYVYQK